MDNGIAHSSKYLAFTMANETFALDIAMVREILDMTEITRIPQMPDFMRGVVNLRGTAVPVTDLRLKFGMGATEHTMNTRIIILVLDDAGEAMHIGLLADSVKEVLELEPSQIAPPPKMGNTVRSEFLKGVARRDDRFIILLNAEKIFSAEELSSVQNELPADEGKPFSLEMTA